MKRELKFRAWDTEKQKMLGSFGLHGAVFIPENTILMQFTNLKDSKNREIYEGDIVKHNWHDNDWQVTTVVWKEGSFTYDNTRYDYEGLLYADRWEVIGNVYENPELLQ